MSVHCMPYHQFVGSASHHQLRRTFADLEPNVIPVLTLVSVAYMSVPVASLPMVLTGGGGNVEAMLYNMGVCWRGGWQEEVESPMIHPQSLPKCRCGLAMQERVEDPCADDRRSTSAKLNLDSWFRFHVVSLCSSHPLHVKLSATTRPCAPGDAAYIYLSPVTSSDRHREHPSEADMT